MAPATKVQLVDENVEALHEDNASGPYSILCLHSKLSGCIPSKTNIKRCDSSSNCTYNLENQNQNCPKGSSSNSDNKIEKNNCTYDLEKKLSYVDNISRVEPPDKTLFGHHRTFDIQNNAKSSEDLRRLVLTEKSSNQNGSRSSLSSSDNLSDDERQTESNKFNLRHNRTRSIENFTPNQTIVKKIVNATYELNQDPNKISSVDDLTYSKAVSVHDSSEQPTFSVNNQTVNLILRNTFEIKKLKHETFLCLSGLQKRTNANADAKEETNSDNSFCSEKARSPLQENLPYFPINKSCENLLNDLTVEVKRRRKSSTKSYKPDGLLRHFPLERPSSLPQTRSSERSPQGSLLNLKILNHSTPGRSDFVDDFKVKLRYSDIKSEKDDDSNKRDSLECDDSLGILTPDQMQDFTQTRSPSLEYNPILSGNLVTKENVPNTNQNKNDQTFPIIDSQKAKDSLDCDESLGILSPDQMQESSQALTYAWSKFIPETEAGLINTNQESNKKNQTLSVDTTKTKDIYEEVQSPNPNSATEYSLGIIDADQMLSGFTNLKSDTTMNLDLPLDSVPNISKDFTLIRCEQTPSPEELPLDTTPIVESDTKTESTTKSKTCSSFITSITSITSLDTGYQGDGEMSRPASRGADNSPLTRRPFPRPQPRRPDPMTDSDFYTESDADNHEDNQLKGDRRAQVIDGTLYGVDPQAAADIYVNNRENMDSSGVFTDIESGNRNDEEGYIEKGQQADHPGNVTVDVSPSESTRTISGNSQNNLNEILQKTDNSSDIFDKTSSLDKTVKENPKKRNAPSPGNSSPSSLSSPRHLKEENVAKKYKMPKREVTSKIKAMLVESPVQSVEKKSVKKPVNKWDAVMNKISKNDQNKTNLKDIKAKVMCVNINTLNNSPKLNEQRKSNVRPSSTQSNKSRRVYTRTSPLKKIIGNNVESSIHSSLSDLSASNSPPKKCPGSAKKRDTIQVTQVLTPNKLTARNQQNLTENKKNVNSISPSSSNEIKPKRTALVFKEKKQQNLIKESSNKPTLKGGRTSPSVRPPAPQTPRAPVKRAPPAPRTVEALAVLVQHLVFNVEAYQVPHLRRQVEKFRLEIEEARLACQQLEETLADQKLKNASDIEEERIRCRNNITELIEKHRNEITQLTSQHAEVEQKLRLEKDNNNQLLSKKHDEQLTILRKELEKLQKSHEESLDILREENDSIREQIDEKRSELEKVQQESAKLKQDYVTKELQFKEEVEGIKAQRDKLKQHIGKTEFDFQEKIKALVEENKRLKEDNDRLLSYGDDKDIGMQEAQSLRAVLELKQTEIAELRKALGQATQKLEILVGAEEKASALQARCEDLQLQLQRKSEYEQGLIKEHQKLQESFKEEINQKRRLSQYNEELQWKLRQNKEVITKVMEQAEESVLFNRSNIYSSSFNEKHNSSKPNLERTLSFRERTHSNKSSISLDGSNRNQKSKTSLEFEMDDLSPPSSPRVKGVVEKSDSVSYVLDLDESPEVVASRIVRRSFRNTTPPKTTPSKSPSNKRPRMRVNPLSISASSSAIITSTREECDRPKSATERKEDDDVFFWNSSPRSYDGDDHFHTSYKSHTGLKLLGNLDLDEDNDVDIELPALPSEMDKRNGVLALPSPKHLASDCVGSDSNSEDESTSSSQL